MFHSVRLLVFILVTVFGWSRYAWCASLTNNVGATNWAPRSANWTDRQDRQQIGNNVNSNSHNLFNADNNANLNGGEKTESYSITPSFSYQFQTNDYEHLDKIVQAHQNPSVDSNSGGGSDVASGTVSSHGAVQDLEGSASTNSQRRSDIVSNLPKTDGSYPGFDFSMYQSQNQAWSNVQPSGDWKIKQDSSPRALAEEKYLSQGVQVRELLDNGTGIVNPSSLYPRQPTTIKSEEIRNKSPWYVYSRQENDNRNPSGTPITYQGQPPQVHTTDSYLSKDNSAKQSSHASTPRSMPVEGNGNFHFSSNKTPEAKRKILQSRQDTSYAADDTGTVGHDDDDHLHFYDHGDEQYEQGQGETHDHDHDHDHGDSGNEYYNDANAVKQTVEDLPLLRDFGGGPGGPPGPGFGGPLPPPPGPLKGSIDYILIPLILIGIGGPIFVVFYVILGGFEYRLAPIARSLQSTYTDYQPYIDNVASSVGRALEKYECPDYAACRLRGFCRKLGLRSSDANSIETTLSSVTPKEYMSTLNSFFSLLKSPEVEMDCSQYKCFSIVDKLPLKF